MKRSVLFVLTCLLALPSLANAAGTAGAAGTPRGTAAEALRRAAESTCNLAGEAGCRVSGLQRRILVDNIAEYSLQVRVGSGPRDIIGLHRVVREVTPFVPARSTKAVLMAHGDAWNFDAAFLASASSASVPDGRALPVFLAKNGIDVWGIDFRWTLIPAGTTDFSFLRNWGIETDARDLGIALGIARATRLLTGSGFSKMHLLGWSRGGITGYAYLDAETEIPRALRQVSGFIPVDIFLKTNSEPQRQAACRRYGEVKAARDGGVLHVETGVLFSTLGTLALTDPNGATPVFPGSGLTNRQAALLAGEATFNFTDPVPFYHFVGGTFSAEGVPTGLLYTDEAAYFEFIRGASPFEPNLVVLETEAAICNDPAVGSVSFDDNLDKITVPVLYVGAGGGFGDYGVYTTTLLGSRDVTVHVPSVVPPEQRISDLGHADIFHARDAQARFWQRILTWIQAH